MLQIRSSSIESSIYLSSLVSNSSLLGAFASGTGDNSVCEMEMLDHPLTSLNVSLSKATILMVPTTTSGVI